MSWRHVTLNQICTTQYGYTASGQEAKVGPKFLRITDIVGQAIDWQTVPHCEIEDSPAQKYRLESGDIVIARTGNTTGYAKLIRNVDDAIFASYLVRIKLNRDIAHPGYVGRLIESDIYKAFVRGIKGGAAQGNANAKTLTLFRFQLPPIDEQKHIAGILSTYDDLIESNRQRVALLEQVARLLYQEWFVRLRFPGHEHIKVTDGVPEGWEYKPLSIMCDDIRESVKPDRVEPDTPYIGLEHIPRRSITISDWGYAKDVASNKFRFMEGDILFGKIRPYFHKVGFALTEGITSSDSIVIRAKDDILYDYLLMLVSCDQFVAIASKAVREGSKMPRADWGFMKRYPVLVPPKHILLNFGDVIKDCLDQLKTLAMYNRSLKQARDLLLPRLMNGEIAV